MNKVEFIDMLRRQISSVEDPVFIRDTLSYYQDYIDTAIRKGRTEEDVLRELGDPRLIAKSIVASRDDSGIYGSRDSRSDTYGSYEYGQTEEERYDGGYGTDTGRYAVYDGKLHIRLKNGRDLALPMGLVKAGGIAGLVLVAAGVGYLAISALPFVAVGLLAVFIIRFIKDNFR